MKIFNKLTALLVSVLLIMSSLGVMAAEGDIKVVGTDYTHTTNAENTNSFGGTAISFASCTLTYKVNVPEAGAYLIRPRFGTHLGQPSDITLEVNGSSLGTQTISPVDSASNFSTQTEYDMAIAWFESGENTFKIGCTRNIYMSYFTLVPQDAGSLKGTRETLKIGDTDYEENGVYPRGTDTITAGYDTPLLAGSFGGIELVDEDTNPVDFEATASGKILTIAIKQSLEYGKGYSLTLSGVKDMYGNVLEEEAFAFGTNDEMNDTGSGSVNIGSFDIVSDNASVDGKVMGSHGKGISGRKVELWITVPGEASAKMADGVSGDDGAYALECNLSDFDINGDVTAEVVAEYAQAPATATKEDYMSAANQIKFTAAAYTNTTDSESTTKGTGNVYYGSNITLTYEFEAVREGGFLLTLEQATHKGNPTTLTFELDGKEIHSYVFDPVTTDGNLGPKGAYDICGVWLTEGTHTFKITNKGTTHRMWNIIFTKQPSADFEAAKIGDTAYAEGDTYYRGTDNLSLSFNADMNGDSLGSITLADDTGKNISLEAKLSESDSKIVVVSLKDSLDYAKTYTLTASGIKDGCGYTMEDVILTFNTSAAEAEDKGSDTAVIDSFEIKNGVATVKGSVKGSTGVGISGRKVDFYLTLPEYSEALAAQGVSGKGGLFTLNYTLENDDAAGDCTAGIKAEYAAEKVTDTYYYVSANRLLPILDSLSKTTQGSGDTEASVEYVLKQNKVNLGIDPDTDLIGISASAFYNMLIGADVDTVAQFHELYKSGIAVEKINEATDVADIEEIIGNDDDVAILGIETAKLSALNNPTGIGKLCEEILGFDTLSGKEDFLEKFDVAFNKALMAQAGMSDITLVSASDSANQGAELELNISSEASYSKVKEIVLNIKFEDVLKNQVNDVAFTSEIGTPEIILSGNSAKVTIKVSDQDNEKTSIGVLSFTGSEVGTGTVRIAGSMSASTGTDYNAELSITEKTYSITVSKQKEDKIGGGLSNRGPSVSGGSVITTVTAPQDTQTVSKTFLDLSQAAWAEEAILGLYNRQAINMTEERLFYPNREITRAEFLKMVVLANDMYTGSTTVVDFNDVSESDWYYQYVEAAVNFKLIQGDGNGCFRPNDLITREDICVILSRVSTAKNAAMTELFADDASISDYAKTAVYVMKESGIVNGIGDNLFAPKANATRAMAAKIIYGLVK